MNIRAVSEQWKVVITVMLGTFTVLLNNSSLNPAIPSFIKVFHTNAATASWLITIFLITMGMTMPLTGYLADRFGKKKVYLSGLALFVTGSLLGSLSWGLAVILCRGLQGMAGGLMIPLSLALIFEAFPKEERGKVTGIWGIAIMAAPMLGPTVGGIVLSLSSWQVLFLMNVPTGPSERPSRTLLPLPSNLSTDSTDLLPLIQACRCKYRWKNRASVVLRSQDKYQIPGYPQFFSLI
jgi:MFS family permease